MSLFAQTKTDVKVDSNANTSREKHDERLNWLRMLEALHSFPENHHGDEYQCNRVGEGRQNAHAVIAEGFASIGGTFRLHNGKPGEAKREDIGNNMSGIGKQGKGICSKTANQFCYQDQHGQKESQAQALFRHAMRMIMPCMYSIHSISIPHLSGRRQVLKSSVYMKIILR